MVQVDGMKVKKMPGKVTNIAKIFEMQQSATKPVPGPEHRLNKENNTSLFRHITGLKVLAGTQRWRCSLCGCGVPSQWRISMEVR